MRVAAAPLKAWHVVVGFAWGVRAVRTARSQLRRGGLSVSLPHPPAISVTGIRGVRLAARILRATCLERSLVLQRWHLAHGREVAVVIGVANEHDTTIAHAWLEGEERTEEWPYVELTRVPPR
jgi:hypothetical protein